MQDTGAGHVGDDPELTETGQRLEQKWKSAGFCVFLTTPADPRSDGVTEVLLKPVATLQRQVNWVKYGMH